MNEFFDLFFLLPVFSLATNNNFSLIGIYIVLKYLIIYLNIPLKKVRIVGIFIEIIFRGFRIFCLYIFAVLAVPVP